MRHTNKTAKGYIIGAVSAACYGLNPLFAVNMYNGGMNVDSVLLSRYVISALLIGLYMVIKRESFSIKSGEIVPLIVMGLLFAFSSLFLFSSYNYMDVGIASTILFVYPVMVAIINSVFFREKVSIITISSILLACVGIALLYKGEDGATLSIIGVVLVMLSSLSYAIYMIAINKSAISKFSPIKLTFYALITGSIVFIIRGLLITEITLPNTCNLWINAFGIAIFPTVISLIFLAVSVRIIGSTYTAILGALEPLTAVIIGVMIFGENLTIKLICGIILILISVMMIILERRKV